MSIPSHAAPANRIKDPGLSFVLAALGLWLAPPLLLLNTPATDLLGSATSLPVTAPDTDPPNEELT